MKKLKKGLLAVVAMIALAGCYNTKKAQRSYELFQSGLDSMGNFEYKELRLKEGDNITIQVYTLATTNQEQVATFNLQGGAGGKTGSYIINNLGEIDLPKLGRTKVTGFTCSQLREKLKNDWVKYIKDPVVDVQMQGFSVNVLGEVKSPGVKTFKSERANLIDVIATAGGLLDEGKREDVLLVREDSGKRTSYRIDLRDAKLYQSPVFQLQQNDMIYVGASERKFVSLRNASLQQDLAPTVSIVSLASFALNVVAIVIAVSRR